MGVFYLIKQRRLVNKAKRGKGTWGRQPEDPAMSAKFERVGTLSARVIRVDGTVEDLGEISTLTRAGGEN